MPPAPLPPDEPERLAALHSYHVLDTESDEALDELVALAARLTGNPVALVALLDADRQWAKARFGVEAPQIDRRISFCAHAILDPARPLVVRDATRDSRFADNDLVTGPTHVRSYLGVPLVDPDGYALGTLCVADRVPKAHTTRSLRIMKALAQAVMVNLELGRAVLRAGELAASDPLTGLLNRPALMSGLAALLAAGRRATVMVVDLDELKAANDAQGQAAGDALLREAARRLRAGLRAGDLVGRIGGDAFALVLADTADRDTAAEVARRISTALHSPVAHDTGMLRLGATLGVAVCADAAEAEMAMRAASEAMVRTKQDSRGGIGWAGRSDASRLQRAGAIIRAMDQDDQRPDRVPGATVHLQPILALDSASATACRVVAVEALGRWSHPELGNVAPDELFAVIGPERTASFGRAVRAEALAAFAGLRARSRGLADARLALNLSAAEVARPEVAIGLIEQVSRAGLSLHDVELEITEEVLHDRVSERVVDQLTFLRAQGARLVLDDFGTGYSGLSQLLRLPLDGLKLDKRFVHRLGVDDRAEEIVRATVALAHSLGLYLVGEGVESEQQAAILRILGCDAVQGFLFAVPLPPERLHAWLGARAGRQVLVGSC